MDLQLFFSIGEGITIAYIDIIVGLLLIVAIIIGLVRGLAKQILGFFGFIAALVGAYFLCAPVTNFVQTSMPKVAETVSGWIAGIEGISEISSLTPENAQAILNQSSIPVFLHGLIINAVQASGGIDLLPLLTTWALNVIVFILLAIVLLIAIAILKKIIYWFANLKFIKPIDKLLGAVFSVVICAALIIVVLAILVTVATEFASALIIPESLTSKGLEFVLNLPFLQGLLSKI